MDDFQDKWFRLKAAVFLTLLVGLIYSNTLNSGWYLDDHHNITRNTMVQMQSLDAEAVVSALYASPGREDLNRPIAFLTFALNWYWGHDDAAGYRIVNIAIHILTAFFLFLTVLRLFQTPNIKEKNRNTIYFVALLASVLWVVHPIQIQAVTYIVQRMASMAALFYILGVFFFLKARMAPTTMYRLIFFGLCGFVFLLGVGTKPNAILLPVSLILTELIFFQDLSQKSTRKKIAAVLVCVVAIVGMAGFFLFMDGSLARIFERYESRTFTLVERILTQPRVIFFYLSQIFYPIADRFSITHDFTVSTSLFSPWTTLPAIMFIGAIIVAGLLRIRKNPLLAFAILFFFGNHVIESTVIPLEMVFEHRNYLPSLFLFVPIAAGIKIALDHYQAIKKPMFYFLVFSVCAVIIGIGTSTYIRNWDWRSAKSLWEDAMAKAPQTARPLQNLAWGYYAPAGHTDKAIDFYERALDLSDNNKGFEIYSYNNMATLYYSRKNNYEKSLMYAQKALSISSNHNRANQLAIRSLCKLGRYDDALSHLERIIEDEPDNLNYHHLKGLIRLITSKPDRALDSFQYVLQTTPDHRQSLREAGFAFTLMGNYDRGFWFLRRARTLQPGDVVILIGLADNRMRAGDIDEAKKWTDRLINRVGPDNIMNELKKNAQDPLGAPFSGENLVSLVSGKLKERAATYSKKAIQLEEEFGSDK